MRVGDLINAERADYRRSSAPAHQDSMGDLHLRVTHVPMDAGAYDTEWLTVRGIEKPTGQPEQPEAVFVIRRSVLLDSEPAAPRGRLW
ncbi:hypothetical protein [Micromonospora sp. NPDC004704]